MYVVWGSTYLGLKYAGETLPPLLMLAARFAAAGPILLFLTLRQGEERPTLVQWRNSAVVGACLLCGGLGLVTLSEKRVPTGVAALMIAATPLWLALLDRVWRGVRLRTTAVVGLAVGFARRGDPRLAERRRVQPRGHRHARHLADPVGVGIDLLARCRHAGAPARRSGL